MANQFINLGGLVAQWLACRTRDREVAGSTPGQCTVRQHSGQVANTHVPLPPSSTIWYRPKGGDALRVGR